jgi:putative adhesin
MKLKLALIAFFVIGLPVVVSAADKTRKAKPQPQKVEQTVEVDPAVNVSVCILSGTVSVHGWDNNQVLARSADAARIELQRSDGAAQTGRAKTIQVVVIDGENKSDDCQAFSDVEISVPRSATIHVQTREGDITIADVAEAYAVSQNGDIEIQGASRSAEVCSVGGSVMIKDSVGRLNLNSVGGSVEVANVRPANPGDSLEAVTVSGDIDLERVEHVQLNARTVNGNVNLSGPLSRGGRYEFKTMSGDVTLAMPEDASFQLNAKVSQSGEIITDFPLQLTPEPAQAPKAPSQAPSTGPRSTALPKLAQPAQPPASPEVVAPPAPLAPRAKVVTIEPTFYKLRKIAASHGSGDAIIYVASFSGTLRLKRSE